MIKIMCTAKDTVKLSALVPFQEDLKKRTIKDIAALSQSLQDDGLLMPFAVWKHDDKDYLLDGHGRLAALVDMALKDPALITDVDYPCIYISADTEDEARKALLQITSSYGKVTRDGAAKFTQTIPGYKAPAINKILYRQAHVKKVPSINTDSLIKIKVPKDKEQEVRELLSKVEFITIID